MNNILFEQCTLTVLSTFNSVYISIYIYIYTKLYLVSGEIVNNLCTLLKIDLDIWIKIKSVQGVKGS